MDKTANKEKRRCVICVLLIILILTIYGCRDSHKPISSINFNDLSSIENYIKNVDTLCYEQERKTTYLLLNYYLNDISSLNYKDTILLNHIYSNQENENLEESGFLYYYYQGIYLQTKENNYKAICSFFKAEQKAISMKNNEQVLGNIYLAISQSYSNIKFNQIADRFLNLAINKFSHIPDSTGYLKSITKQMLFVTDTGEKIFDNEVYEQIKDYCIRYNDLPFLEELQKELISYYIAINCPEYVFHLYNDFENNSTDNSSQNIKSLYKGYRLYLENDYQKAISYFEEIEKHPLRIKEAYICRKYLYFSHKELGNNELALSNLEKSMDLFHDLVNQPQRTALKQIQDIANNIKLELEYQKKIQNIFILKCVFGLFIFIFLSGVSFLVIRLKKKKSELENHLIMMQNLKESRKTLLEKLNINQENEKILKHEIEKKLSSARLIADLYYKYSTKPGIIIKKLNELVELAPLNEGFAQNLIQNVNLYYNNCIQKLSKQHLELNESDLFFSSLLIAGFSLQEMCVIFNSTSMDAMYTRKHRLKQKLKLEKQKDLEKYLHSFAK